MVALPMVLCRRKLIEYMQKLKTIKIYLVQTTNGHLLSKASNLNKPIVLPIFDLFYPIWALLDIA